jgi:DNA repair protein RadC
MIKAKKIDKNYYSLVEVSIQRKKRIAPFDVVIRSPMDAGRFFSHLLSHKDREVLGIIGLDLKNHITYFEVAHIGTLSQSMIHPREIFKSSILTNTNAIIMAHNHPSGDVTPSQADRIATHKMLNAGELMGIEVVDHIIIAKDKYFSIKENKLTYLERTKDE